MELMGDYEAHLRRRLARLQEENVLLHFELTERDDLIEKLRLRVRRLGMQLLLQRVHPPSDEELE